MSTAQHPFTALCERVRLPIDAPAEFSAVRSSAAHQAAISIVARARATGLRATKGTVPALARSVERVADALMLDRAPEVYVVADPTINAKAVWAGGIDRSLIIVHSGLALLLGGTELDFVLGHELGHLGLAHANRSMHDAVDDNASELDVLRMRLADRAAELSADRVGLVAARSASTAARVIMKTASGLDNDRLGVDVDSFLSQLDDGSLDEQWELSATHPGLPLRLWAMQRFTRSETYSLLTSNPGSSIAQERIDGEVESRLRAEAGDSLGQFETAAVDRAVYWLAITEALHAAAVDLRWMRAIDARFGAGEAAKGQRFLANFGGPKLALKTTEHVASALSFGSAAARRVADELQNLATNAGKSASMPWSSAEVRTHLSRTTRTPLPRT